MKLIYTHSNELLVELAKSHLKNAGFEPVLKNAFLQGGAGELAPIDAWPELWVSNVQADAAKKLLDGINENKKPWLCAHCQEKNEEAFDICWQCQRPAPNIL